MDRLEKIVWFVTGLAVLAVVAFAAIGPLKSEIDDRTVDYMFERANPSLAATRRARPQIGAPTRIAQPTTFQAQGGGRPAAAPATARPGAQPAAQPAPQPWAPPQQPYNPGVTVGGPSTPVVIPETMAAKYQHFEDIVQLGMTAYGEDVTLPDGSTGFQLQEIQDESPLVQRLGFQPGDTIVSVNGYPANKSNGRQLYETLKNERTFNVVILRGGQQQTLVYHRGG